MFKKISKFLQEVKQEMSKVSWPAKEELKDSTIIVIVLSLILAVFIFLTDKILSEILKIIY